LPLVGEFDESLGLQAIQVLPHGHRRDAKPARNVSRALRPASLQLVEDALLSARVVFHELRWYRPRNISQAIA
jgi:hypothetical protein